jgi:hydrogenase small subunit
MKATMSTKNKPNPEKLPRRSFLQLAATLGAAFPIASLPAPVQAALKKVPPSELPKIIYLQGQSCTGCSISLLQARHPSPAAMITRHSQLVFHADLSAASGKTALDLINTYLSGKAGPYFLALEGAIPAKMPSACVIGHETLESLLLRAAKTMAGAIAVGTCAAGGGIPAAEGNPTGAENFKSFLTRHSLSPLLLELPGCPVHPDWLWHTVIMLARAGVPRLRELSPAEFYGVTVHERCPRYHYFQEEIFARRPGDEGCLFELGCAGPVSYADCPVRWWNGGTTWCIDSGAPCIGCASKDLFRQKRHPLYTFSSGTAGSHSTSQGDSQ